MTGHEAARGAEPICVLCVVKTLDRGGAETLVLQQLRTSVASDVEYRVAYVRPSGPQLLPEIEERGVAVHCLGSESSWDPTWLLRLLALIRRTRPHVVHVHSPLVAALVRPTLRCLRDRPLLVVTDHSVTYSSALTRWADRATHPLDDVAIAVSDTVAERTRSRFRVPHVIVQGVDLATIDAAIRNRSTTREALGVTEHEVLVVTVANARPEKDYPNLIEAARRVCRRDPSVRFVAVGGGSMRAEVADLVDRSGMGERFRFLGEVPGAVRFTAAGDLFVLASKWEGLPVALMEAVAAGVPVAATDVGGVHQLVIEGENGLLVPPGAPGALADAILALAEAPVTRTRMSAAARACRPTIDAAAATRQIEQLYRDRATVSR